MDEQEIDPIVVNLLTPFIARVLGWAGATLLGGAGISLNIPGDAAGKIALAIVGLAAMVIHQVLAKASNTKIAQAGFVQGAAAAGATVQSYELPNVVNGPAPVVAPLVVNSTMPPPPAPLAFTANPDGTVRVDPSLKK